jgi:hypothetical protein
LFIDIDNFWINEFINKTNNMKKDIEISVTETKSVEHVSYEELYNSLRDRIRLIQQLNDKYENDEDFGRNLRKLLNLGG